MLLKTDVCQPRGYIAKLGDFGLARVLGPSGTVLNAACAGTVNHLAPELFVPGSAITTAVDAYAFGVLLWELYTGGGHAHAGGWLGVGGPAVCLRLGGHGGSKAAFGVLFCTLAQAPIS